MEGGEIKDLYAQQVLLRGSNSQLKEVRTEYKQIQATADGNYNPLVSASVCLAPPGVSQSKSWEQNLCILALQYFSTYSYSKTTWETF